MQVLNPQQVRQVYGAGALDRALVRWYLSTLNGDSVPLPTTGMQL